MPTPLAFPAAALFSLLCFVLPVQAAIKTNLERTTPVPAGETIPIADFFRPSVIRSASINQAGTFLVGVVADNADRHHLLVYDMAGKSYKTLGASGKMEIGSYHWVDDHRVVYTIIKDKLYNYGLFSTDIRDLDGASPLIQGCETYFLGASDHHSGKPLVWIKSNPFNNGSDDGVYRVNPKFKAGQLIDWGRAGLKWSDVADVRDDNDKHLEDSYEAPKKGVVGSYMVDKEGELAFAQVFREGVPSLVFREGKQWGQSPVNADELDVISAGNAPGELLVGGYREKGKPRPVHFMDSKTGAKGMLLYQDDGYDFDGYPYRDPVSHDIIGLFTSRGYPRVIWFTESYRQLQKKMEQLFPRQFVRIHGSNKAQTIFVVSTESDQNPVVYHWLDVANNTMGLLKKSRPWIDPERMQPMRLFKYTTRDGYKLDAYLTLPAGVSKQRPAPLVVLPHGGPWMRDYWGFDSEVQFLASRGYAVLQPNYRGSTGFDWMFPLQDRWDFLKMQYDVSDAAAALLATGNIDPDRVAIMGTSFGAYHAIAGAEETPCKYRCAVAIAGVFDWEKVMNRLKRERYESLHYSYMSRFLGDPSAQKEKYAAISPIRQLDKIRIPIFVAHGKDDHIAEISESKSLVAGLKEKGVPYEVIYFSSEGHGTHNIDNTVDLYSRIEAFLAKNLAPRPAR